MEEIIKPINGYPGYYVSNLGNVYSEWIQIYKKGRRGAIGMRTDFKKKLKEIRSSSRSIVGLNKNGKKKVFRIHRLVLEAFVGKRPKNMEACHFPDAYTGNNRLDNLRWDTKKANYADRIKSGNDNSGERNGSSILKTKDVIKILELRKNNLKIKKIALLFNMSYMTIYNICNNKSWRHIKRG